MPPRRRPHPAPPERTRRRQCLPPPRSVPREPLASRGPGRRLASLPARGRRPQHPGRSRPRLRAPLPRRRMRHRRPERVPRRRVARSSDQLVIDAPREGDVARALFEHHFEPFFLVKRQYEVHAVVRTDGCVDITQLAAKRFRLRPGGGQCSRRAPIPDTALTSFRVVAGPIGACMTGTFQGTRISASVVTPGLASVRECHPRLRQLALTAVREDSGQLVLREIEDRDLDVLFEHWTGSRRDTDGRVHFAGYSDRTAFERRWARLRSDVSTTNRVVEIDGRVVGQIASFDLEGRREVTYWIGREDWGRGIATRALREFL